MPTLIPYGENGVTNKLLESFITERNVYREFIARVHWGDEGKQHQKTTLGKSIKVIVQQMGLGRMKGKGEPDGVIIGNGYVILLETKMDRISALVRKNKKEILNNYIALGTKIANKDWSPPKSYVKNAYLTKHIIEPCQRVSNKHWYLLFITDGSWEENRKKHAEILAELITNNSTSKHHFGWIGLDSVRSLSKKHKLTGLQNALKANGKWYGK